MTLHDQLMRLYAKRGEVTLVLEQLDLVDIVRTRAMFDLESAINARTSNGEASHDRTAPAPGSNAGAGEETTARASLASKTDRKSVV